jgi:hypothetical protein
MFSGSELNHRLRLDPARSGVFPSVAAGLHRVKYREAKKHSENSEEMIILRHCVCLLLALGLSSF